VIESTISGNFGVTKMEEGGCVLNMQVGVEQIVHIPLPADPLLVFIKAAVQTLSDEQKRELVPLLTGGIILPGFDGLQNGPPQG
jgi:hypothetical protein